MAEEPQADQPVHSFVSLATSFVAVSGAINAWFKTHQADIERAMAGVGSVVAGVSTVLNDFAKSATDSFNARMEVYPALANEIGPLAKRGWFVSMFFPLSDLDLLAHIAGADAPAELDLLIAQLYREGISYHAEVMFQEYPGRAFLLRPAMDAHLRGEYSISIPLFFILADGICFERAEKDLFHGYGDNHITSRARAELEAANERAAENPISDFFSLLSSAMWASISEKLPLAYNRGMRDRCEYDGLNRNTILHGIADESYATEENSLKAFSLLSFLASLLASENGSSQ